MRARMLRKNLLRPYRPISVKPDGEALRVSIGSETILLASAARWPKYWKGVGQRLDLVARQYGLFDLAPLFKDKTVIDIGANIGEFSLFAAQAGANVIAIEPDRPVFETLARNVAGLRVKPICALLWHEAAELTFYTSSADADSSVFRPDHVESVSVRQAVPLDDLIPADVDEIIAIKADAEGAEPEVLRGASRTLRRTRMIAIDCGAERLGSETIDDCAGILDSLGFDVGVARRARAMVVGLRR
jgi:FkbM family methyltransferase